MFVTKSHGPIAAGAEPSVVSHLHQKIHSVLLPAIDRDVNYDTHSARRMHSPVVSWSSRVQSPTGNPVPLCSHVPSSQYASPDQAPATATHIAPGDQRSAPVKTIEIESNDH